MAKTLSFNVFDTEDKANNKTNEPEWIYETGRDEPEILGSGSYTYNVVKTKDEDEAFCLFKECARNYISRSRKVNSEKVYQWYDSYSKTWIE